MSTRTIENRIICPSCGGGLDFVKDSRPHDIFGAKGIKRRRECSGCGQRVTTFEMKEDDLNLDDIRREIAKDMIVNLLAEMQR